MSKVLLLAMSSLDGMSAGPGEGAERIDWFRADEEWDDYSVELLDQVTTLVFGRRTFDGMSKYWPGQTDPVGQRMNAHQKIAFSRNATTTSWEGARFSTDPVGEISSLRGGDRGDALIMGSADLAATLSAHGLIDEYRIAINPVVLGSGTPLFAPGGTRMNLDRTDTRLFRSGIVEVRYTPTEHER